MTMKDIFNVVAALFFFSASSGFGGCGFVALGNMLMGNSLGQYLSDLVSFDSLTLTQMDDIMDIAENTTSSNRFDMFATEESKNALRVYLRAEVTASNMEEDTAEMIASMASLGALYPTEQLDLIGFAGPAEKSYTGNGNLVRLARIQPRGTDIRSNIYVGVWGVNKGSREYALQTSTYGLEIIDVTDPRDPFRVQSIPMSGGYLWRDVGTHTDDASGKVYAYVAAQDVNSGTASDLFALDLSSLSGNINSPNGEDSNPIPGGSIKDLGNSGFGHTVTVAGGFLFLNVANASRGCRVYSLSNPMQPNFIFSHSGNGKDCHDSSLHENVNVDGQSKTIWIVSEGTGMKESILDFTNVKTTLSAPPLISTTPKENGIYAHSSTLSSDKRFLFQTDENNLGDIYVYDITNVSNPRLINIFQYAEESSSNAMPHNCHVKRRYLYCAYYEAGYLAFDISNPYDVAEVGRVETYRDPNNTGSNSNQIRGQYRGAWNAYVGLKSGNMLVSDMFYGLYIVKANSPYPKPNAPNVSVQRNADNGVTVTWNAVANVRAYHVERSIGGQSFVTIAEFLTVTSYFDDSVKDQSASYKVKAVNGEGTGVSPVAESAVITASPTNLPTNQPTPRPSAGPTPLPTSPPSKAPTPQPSPNPTPAPSNSPTPVPTTAAPTKDISYRAADGCLRGGETQVDQCFTPVIANGRAVSCCKGQESTFDLECSRSGCLLATSFLEATAHCEDKGMRLCTVQELELGVCCGTGCNFDARVNWTADSCDTPQTPEPTQSPTTPEPTPPPPTPPPVALPTTPLPTFYATDAEFQPVDEPEPEPL